MMSTFKEQFMANYYPRLKLQLNYWVGRLGEVLQRVWSDVRRDIDYLLVTEEQLISRESQIGRLLFGDVPIGHEREFFNVNEHVWIWYESWRDELGKKQQRIVKYDVRLSGVWKRIDEGLPEPLAGAELENFVAAMGIYFQQVMHEVYSRDPVTGQLLPDHMR